MLHIALHFLVPLALASTVYRRRVWQAFGLLMVGMVIDLDHLLATPIYDAGRCSIGFHPLHTLVPMLAYIALMIYPRTRLIGMGLCIHILLDSIDCQFTNGVWFQLPRTVNMQADIRHAAFTDVPAITEIYNHYVVETPITFDLVPKTLADREIWFADFAQAGRNQLLVARLDNRVAGYVCSHKFREKQAYETSIETTIYLHPDFTGHGLGGQLYEALFASIRNEDVHRAFAGDHVAQSRVGCPT